jgi:hypothetical protein
LKDRSLWNAIGTWNRLAGGWKFDGSVLSDEDAKARAALCGQFLTRHPDFPAMAEVVAYQKHVEALARRAGGADGPLPRLTRLLSDVLVDRVWMVTVADQDANYYSMAQPVERGSLVQFDGITSFAGKIRSRAIDKDRIVYSGLSPQSKIAAVFKPILADGAKLARWETVMIDLVQKILDEPKIDPILQVALLRKVFDAAGEGSEPLRQALGPMQAKLAQSGVDVNVPWMDPEAHKLDRSRAEAASCVKLLRDMVPPAKEISSLQETIEQGVSRTFCTLGWLASERNGWEVRTGATVPQQGNLWVVVPTENRHGEWKKVGTIDHGKPKLNALDESILAEGRPVFVIVKSLYYPGKQERPIRARRASE